MRRLVVDFRRMDQKRRTDRSRLFFASVYPTDDEERAINKLLLLLIKVSGLSCLRTVVGIERRLGEKPVEKYFFAVNKKAMSDRGMKDVP